MIKFGVALLGAVWFCAACVGLKVVWTYDNTPGIAAAPEHGWPPASAIPRVAGRPTLLVFAHPCCPCTGATIDEVANIAAQCRDRVSVRVLFFRPTDSSPGWGATDIRRAVENIAGIQVLTDKGGVEARRFHALTSGQTMLYDADGRLQFRGGITGSRGHSDSNPGSDAVVSLILNGKATLDHTPVYGCSLLAIAPKSE